MVACASALALGCEDHFVSAPLPTNPPSTGERPVQETVDLAGLMNIDVQFELRAGGKPFDCSSEPVVIGQVPSDSRLRDARLFVSDLRFVDDAGKSHDAVLKPDDTYQQKRVGLLDFEDGSGDCKDGDPATNTVLHAAVVRGNYHGIGFSVGVPEDLNHADPLVAWPPLNVMAMHWTWLDGYRFIRTEVMRPDMTEVDVHLGSDRCKSQAKGSVSCAAPNRAAVVLADFDPASDTIVVDLSAMFGGSDLTSDSPGCIVGSDEETCIPIFASFGLDQKTGAADATKQLVFTVAPR
jgi:uncharacterized repeat protein (TIGR04052 family)